MNNLSDNTPSFEESLEWADNKKKLEESYFNTWYLIFFSVFFCVIFVLILIMIFYEEDDRLGPSRHNRSRRDSRYLSGRRIGHTLTDSADNTTADQTSEYETYIEEVPKNAPLPLGAEILEQVPVKN